MRWRVLLGRRAEKNIRAASPPERARIKEGLLALGTDPVTPRAGTDIKPLKGTDRLYRIRIGPWRAIYGIEGNDVIVTDVFRKKRGYDP